MIIAVAVLILLFLALLALGFWISGLLLYPNRQPVIRTPANCSLPYEDVTFPSSDGLALKGWWIPIQGASPMQQRPAVVLLHPLFGNRHGFSPRRQPAPHLFRTEVDLLKTAQGFHQAGYQVLVFDFRSHGDSQRGLCAGGLTEDQDVASAVDYVFNRLAAEGTGKEAPQVGVVGFGMGAAAALVAIGRDKSGTEKIKFYSGDTEGGSGFTEIRPPNVKLLRFLVAVQPASLGQLVRSYLRQFSAFLSWILFPLLDRLCQWRGGYPLEQAALLRFAAEVRIPVLYVQARPDTWGGCAEVQSLYDVTPDPKQIWWIEQSLGRLEAYDYVGDHLEPLLAFAAQHVSPAVKPCPAKASMVPG